MLTEVCAYLRNYFDRGQPKFYGAFEVKNGVIESYNDGDMGIADGQYFRIIGSVFCDGVWQYGNDTLPKDEIFNGTVWLMAVPSDVVALVGEIEAWMQKYATVDSANMSPYTSESFGGYSYSKAQGSGSAGGTSPAGWQDNFGARLMRYKRI